MVIPLCYRLSSLPTYYIPKDGSLQTYKVSCPCNALKTIGHMRMYLLYVNLGIH